MPHELDSIDREYLKEMARILGHSEGHEKIAAMAGTPMASALQKAAKAKAKEMEKVASLTKISSMSLRGILEDANFHRGFEDEIEARRSLWEPAIMEWLQGEE